MRRRYMSPPLPQIEQYTLELNYIGGENIQVYADGELVGSVRGGNGKRVFTWEHPKYTEDIIVSIQGYEDIVSDVVRVTQPMAFVGTAFQTYAEQILIADGQTAYVTDTSTYYSCNCYTDVTCNKQTTYKPQTSVRLPVRGANKVVLNADIYEEYGYINLVGSQKDYIRTATGSYNGELTDPGSADNRIEFGYGTGQIIVGTDAGWDYFIEVG